MRHRTQESYYFFFVSHELRQSVPHSERTEKFDSTAFPVFVLHVGISVGVCICVNMRHCFPVFGTNLKDALGRNRLAPAPGIWVRLMRFFSFMHSWQPCPAIPLSCDVEVSSCAGRNASKVFSDLVWAKQIMLKVEETASAAQSLLANLSGADRLLVACDEVKQSVKVCGGLPVLDSAGIP